MFKKRTLVIALTAAITSLAGCNSETTEETDPSEPVNVLQYVDPFIGTGFNGHTFPGAVVPEGFVQLSPDTHLTGWHSSSGYHYDDDTVYGFSHTHLSGTGIGDLGDILFMPYSDDQQRESSKFQKSNEQAGAGYYQVKLDDSGINAELTATQRVGLHRYTYADQQSQKLKVDLGHTLNEDWGGVSLENEITFVDENTIIGKRISGGWADGQQVFFIAKFSSPIKSYTITNEGEQVDGSTANGKDVVSFIEFEPSESPIEIKVALSPVSTQGAEDNLNAEAASINFDQARAQAENKWKDSLESFQIEGGTETEKTIFYSALYHTKLAPMIHQDVDGQYPGMDKNIYQNFDGKTNYTVYSMWDTFRALHPLKTITEPQRAVDYAMNLIQKQKEGGLLPKWELHGNYTGTMVGYPAVSVIADAMIKYPQEFTPQDFEDAMLAGIASSTWHPEDFQHWDQELLSKVMTLHIKYIDEEGFAPADETAESVSYGLENAYYDWCIAQIAQLAGNQQVYDTYMQRSKGFERYFDYNPAEYSEHNVSGFMRPVLLDSSWRTPFDPYNAEHETGDYTEGNSWQWTWFAPHDINGLKTLMGGEEDFRKNLDGLFNAEEQEGTADMTGLIGQYVHGNEPDQHVPYLYNYTSTPWKTQEYVDQILEEFYLATPEGIVGNEDVGQMSAWYVLSALGFYQITPGDSTYTIGRPLFDKATIPVENGEFTITAENNGPDNLYVKSVSINGQPLSEGLFFDHSEFKAGGTLHFVMSATPPQS
ncbi:GH92 family glycosyl hydrolase [Psychromonas aquimarina]|uniref:GH92 family glycosyl hydrolase n=1 Tax=Psychromonas aquimarina TaxID=444919 RepID=UPI0003FE94B3|nr:GH92 family glycosyl hydrolase [Psychromonas aquimarina]